MRPRSFSLASFPGMELTTSEDIHVICLFPELENAMAFGDEVDSRRILIKNRTDIFGDQLILDGEDNVIGTEEHFLSNATTISLDEAPGLAECFNGVCYPAHIDRQANGVISVLGTMPETPEFSTIEINRREKVGEYVERYSLQGKRVIISSDAHYLTDIREENEYIEIDDEPYSSATVRRRLIELLK